MKKMIFFLFLTSIYSCFSQWELTNWNNISVAGKVWASGDIAISEGDKLITTDRGKSWTSFKNLIDIPNGINCIEIYKNMIFIVSLDKFYVSNNYGKTWDEFPFGNSDCTDLLAVDNKLFAGTWKDGILLSEDNGKTWIPKNNGLSKKQINSFALVGSNIFASIGDNEIYLSTDQGDTWIPKNNGLENASFNQFAVIEDKIFVTSFDNNTIDGSNKVIYMSADLGNTWTKKKNLEQFKLSKYSIAAIGKRLFIGYSEDLLYSDDLGETWIKKSVTDNYYRSTEYLAVGDAVVYGTSGTEIFVSYDNGDTWTSVMNAQNYGAVNSLFEKENTIYSCTTPWRNYTSDQNGLYYSTDNGNSWLSFGFDSLGVSSLFFKDNYTFASTDDGLYRMDIQSLSWKNIKDKLRYRELALLGSRLFYTDYGGYFISEDNGDTWIEVKDKLPPHQFVNKFFVDNNSIIACLDSNVFISDNKGEVWENISNGLPYDNLKINSIEKIDDVIFLGTTYGVYISSDMGKNWVAHNNGLPLDDRNLIEVKDFEVIGKNIFVGVRLSGVFLSTDMGTSWKYTNISSFKNQEISSLVIQGDYIYAGTNRGEFGDRGDAIYKAKLSDFGITSVNEDQATIRHSLSPNPATDFITINYDYEGNVASSPALIYDILGVKVAQEPLINGSNKINISHLTPGVYFIKIGDRVEKFIKI
ncbi:MAG TPA: T9SS type A sorting domain-containing protein [Candidatus Kapabacteria bacterium]|nr:T9SS type A sorting domain-containing protein [Candidatus Kapabacteria bacterium]